MYKTRPSSHKDNWFTSEKLIQVSLQDIVFFRKGKGFVCDNISTCFHIQQIFIRALITSALRLFFTGLITSSIALVFLG